MKLARIRCPEERGGATVAYLVSYAEGDFDATSSPETITLDALLQGDVIRPDACKIVVKTALAGGSTSAATAALGVTGDTDRLISPQDCFTGAGGNTLVPVSGTPNAAENADGKPYSVTSATSLLLTIALTGDTPDDLTSGELIVLVGLDRGSDLHSDLQF